MRYLKAYSERMKSYIFWIMIYFEEFGCHPPDFFEELRDQAKRDGEETWSLFFEIADLACRYEFEQCYHFSKRFMETRGQSTDPEVQAAIPIVTGYHYHALYECGYYKEALDGMEDLWRKYKRYAMLRQGHALYLFFTFKWKELRLLPIYHQTVAWLCFMRACLLGRHQYYKLSLQSYEELENIFSRFDGAHYQYWVARSLLDRGKIYGDLKDTEKQIALFDQVINKYQNSKDVLVQFIVSLSGAIKSLCLYDQSKLMEAHATIDWVIQRNKPPKPDYLVGIYIAAAANKSLMLSKSKEWQAFHKLKKQCYEEIDIAANNISRLFTATLIFDIGVSLVMTDRIDEAIKMFVQVVETYRYDDDIFILITVKKAADHAVYLTKQKDKLNTTIIKKQLQLSLPQKNKLSDHFHNPNLN